MANLYPCRGCQKELPRTAEFFHRNASRADGLQAECKACMCAMVKRCYENRKLRQASVPAPSIDTAVEISAIVGPADEKRFQALFDRGLRIVRQFRDSWPALEEITQPWTGPEPV